MHGLLVAVRQSFNPTTETWTKRDSNNGQFMALSGRNRHTHAAAITPTPSHTALPALLAPPPHLRYSLIPRFGNHRSDINRLGPSPTPPEELTASKRGSALAPDSF